MVYLLALVSPVLVGRAYAFINIQNRSISIGSSAGGANTSHTFSFDIPISTSVGSIRFQYCTDPIDEIACVTPNGLDISGVTFDSQSGETGFSLSSVTANEIILGRPAAAAGPQTNSYAFSNIINPSDIGPFFVRISLYPTSDASGSYTAFGSVAASIDTGININAEVPPILYFCSAISIPTDCSDAVGDFIEFGTLLTSATSAGTSQFMVGTNAPNGYTVTANGPTMTSGTNQITAVAPPSNSQTGISQFGMNLRANLSPPVGAEPNGIGGIVGAAYATPNKFNYGNGDIVAKNPGPSELELYTVSYIVNVHSGQPAGIYNTTLTYVCTAGF